jgi:hypothetical protein
MLQNNNAIAELEKRLWGAADHGFQNSIYVAGSNMMKVNV